MRGLRVVAAAGVLITAGTLVAWPAAAKTEDVSIKNIAYVPASLTIDAGDRVIWTNNENAVPPINHTVTADGGAFASPNLTPSSSFTFTFGAPGTYPYHCEIHDSMHGTVVVRAATTSTARPTTTATTARPTTTTRRATTSSSSISTSTSLEEETTTTTEETTSTTAGEIAINEDDGGGTNGAAVALLVTGILAVLGGGGYLLYRLRTGRF